MIEKIVMSVLPIPVASVICRLSKIHVDSELATEETSAIIVLCELVVVEAVGVSTAVDVSLV